MVYIYDSHLDGFYTNNKKLDDDFLYCETCGDSDYLIDSIRNNPTFNELKNLFYYYCKYESINYALLILETIKESRDMKLNEDTKIKLNNFIERKIKKENNLYI